MRRDTTTLASKTDDRIGSQDRDAGYLRRACKTGSFLPPPPVETPTRVDGPKSAGRRAAPAEASVPVFFDDDSTSPYKVGRVINARYRLLRPLGRGGMGEVWSAQHLSLNTVMAIKFLACDSAGERSRAALERFRFEAQVSAQIGMKTNHVVTIHDAGLDESGPYLVMEYVRGRTLRTELTQKGPMSADAVAALLEQIARAMTAAHEAGIIHRDLKPSNLLLCDGPEGSLYVKVADFGIAKAIRPGLPITNPADCPEGFVLGSPSYMSPEQLSAGVLDAKSDLWSLGVVAYEALTGRLPFNGRTVPELIASTAQKHPESVRAARPELPAELDAFFARALAKEKEKRFESARAMADAFRAALAPKQNKSPKKSRFRSVAAIFAAVTAVCLTASAATYFLRAAAPSEARAAEPPAAQTNR